MTVSTCTTVMTGPGIIAFTGGHGSAAPSKCVRLGATRFNDGSVLYILLPGDSRHNQPFSTTERHMLQSAMFIAVDGSQCFRTPSLDDMSSITDDSLCVQLTAWPAFDFTGTRVYDQLDSDVVRQLIINRWTVTLSVMAS